MVENYIRSQAFNITLNYFIFVIMLQMNSVELGFYMHTKTARRDSCSHYISVCLWTVNESETSQSFLLFY